MFQGQTRQHCLNSSLTHSNNVNIATNITPLNTQTTGGSHDPPQQLVRDLLPSSLLPKLRRMVELMLQVVLCFVLCVFFVWVCVETCVVGCGVCV